jgi:hypothetical protein
LFRLNRFSPLFQPQLDELRPHLPEFDGLLVRGEGLERRIVAELQQVRNQLEADLDGGDSDGEEEEVGRWAQLRWCGLVCYGYCNRHLDI